MSPEEIALFIDFDNIRFSMLNIQRHEPDPQELIAAARRYGTIMVARAYADWSRQPETFKGSLTAAMIDRVDCPVKLRQRIRMGTAYEGVPSQGGPSQGGPSWSGGPANDPNFPVRYSSTTSNTKPLPAVSLPSNFLPDEQGFEGDDNLLYSSESAAPRNQPYPGAATAFQDDERDPFSARRTTEHLSANPSEMSKYGPGIPTSITSTMVQSTVDLNMVMDIIETVFDRPSISTYVLMTGDKDFTRICARLKLRLNKNVIIVGVPGTVSRDLISSASQFVPLVPLFNTPDSPLSLTSEGEMESGSARTFPRSSYTDSDQPYEGPSDGSSVPTIDPLDPLFIQFLDYIDRNWPLRTTSSIAHFLGDPFNPKNRFRGRFTRESARELLHICIQQKIVLMYTGATGIPELSLNRTHPEVAEVLKQG